ncbi:MAG: hypothetical protein CTY10_08130 [Methylotenera sp.]|nr:MAG: hypothetical protein CTY10_08130 [Methylotenera sp.]
MKCILSLLKFLWWVGVSYIPIAIHNLEQQLKTNIGCPPVGDCYVKGSEILLEFDMLIIIFALYLWPVCVWFVGGRYIFNALYSYFHKR